MGVSVTCSRKKESSVSVPRQAQHCTQRALHLVHTLCLAQLLLVYYGHSQTFQGFKFAICEVPSQKLSNWPRRYGHRSYFTHSPKNSFCISFILSASVLELSPTFILLYFISETLSTWCCGSKCTCQGLTSSSACL